MKKLPTPTNQLPTFARGYTLIELIVAVGLFALIMTLASGAYLLMVGINRQAQSVATGIDNLSFALETMTRGIRTGTDYCSGGCLTNRFSFRDTDGANIAYTRGVSGGKGYITRNGVALTDPSVDIASLSFYVSGAAASDRLQPRVTIVVKGTVSPGPGKPPQSFTVETGATMRGSDL